MCNLFAANPQPVQATAKRNPSLQALTSALLREPLDSIAARCRRFDNAKLGEDFFDAGKGCEGCEEKFVPEGHVKPNSYAIRITEIQRNFIRACRVSRSRSVHAALAL